MTLRNGSVEGNACVAANQVVCFLVVNKIPNLPKLAIESALKYTRKPIVIGYLNEDDIQELPKNEQINYLSLKETLILEDFNLDFLAQSRDYFTFDQESFFHLVRIKWTMFRILLANYEQVVYSDLDVIWLADVTNDIANHFLTHPDCDVAVQDFTFYLSEPKLCMGLFAIKKSQFSEQIILRCSELHAQGLANSPKFSDDDAISQFFQEPLGRSRIMKLPQQSYPVGNLMNLYLPLSVVRGLRPRRPMIFHSNFVVGAAKKYLLLNFVLMIYEPGFRRLLTLGRYYAKVVKDAIWR